MQHQCSIMAIFIKMWPWYLTLTHLDLVTKERFLLQGIHMWNMKSSSVTIQKLWPMLKFFWKYGLNNWHWPWQMTLILVRLIDWMVFYATFNSTSVPSRYQLTLFMSFLGFTSTRLGLWSVLPKDTPKKNPHDLVQLEPRTPGLWVKHFTTEPRRTSWPWSEEEGLTIRNTYVKYEMSLTNYSKSSFFENYDLHIWQMTLQMTLAPKKKSCPNIYTCEIWKLYHLPLKNYGQW